MTNLDFDQDDGRELAEFAGYRVENDLVYDSEEVICRLSNSYAGGGWKPWSLKAPMWQLQSLYDAVREKGLESKFNIEMLRQIQERENISTATNVGSFDKYSAPPEAICEAILNLEGE